MAELPIGWLGPRGGTPLAAAFLRFMASHLRGGTLIVVDPDGTRRFGEGSPEVTGRSPRLRIRVRVVRSSQSHSPSA